MGWQEAMLHKRYDKLLQPAANPSHMCSWYYVIICILIIIIFLVALMKPRASESQAQTHKHAKPMQQPKEEDEDEGLEEVGDEGGEDGEEEHGETLCGACGDNYASDEFWICCDVCEKWFHGKCVKITPARAEHIKQYKCPSCSTSNKRARPP